MGVQLLGGGGAEHTALGFTRVDDQLGGDVASNSHHLGPACQGVIYPAADGDLQAKIYETKTGRERGR